jgi:predicted dehydrogenase/nucleoside-diphosphate-sugar epimerase
MPRNNQTAKQIVSGRPFRFAVLGGGAVVTYLYLPALALTRRIELTAVADPSRAALDAVHQAGFRGALLEMNWRDALATLRQCVVRPDAIIIALPNALHEEACLGTLDAGFPVLCEKPLALTRQACERIAERSRATGLAVGVGMVRRLLPSVAALRQALQKKLIGDLLRVEVEDGLYYRWLSNTGAYFQPASGGILADMGVHYLDLLVDLLGELEPQTYEDDWAGGVEANADFRLATAGGLPVRVRLSRDRDLDNRLVVYGSLGTLAIGKEEFGYCRWKPLGEGDLEAKLESRQPFRDASWPKDFIPCFAEQFEAFADAAAGAAPPRCTAAQAAHVIGLIEWAYGSRGLALAQRPGRGAAAFGHLVCSGGGPQLPGGKCVVTGGSGFIGSRLVDRLTAAGTSEVVAPVRSYMHVVELARFGAAMPKVDLLDPEAARNLVKGARYVFHLAYGRDGADAARITVDGTRNVVEAAIAEGCEAVVVLSTMSVFGFPGGGAEVDESWPYDPVLGEYGRTKMKMEQWCLHKATETQKTRIVVLNPTNVWGPQGQTYTRLPLEYAAKGTFCWVDGGRGLANLVYVENLIDAILLAATAPAAHGRRFLICDTITTWREFLTPLLGERAASLPDLSGAELDRLSLPARTGVRDVMRAVASSADVRSAIKGMPLVGSVAQWWWRKRKRAPLGAIANGQASTAAAVPPAWLQALFGPTTTRFSSAAARATLHWTPRTDHALALAETIQWLMAIGLRTDAARQTAKQDAMVPSGA